MINTVALVCPKCGANLQIEEGRTQCFCSYCGTKITIQNDNEYVVRIVDEARIKEAELNAKMSVKRSEEKERRCEASRRFFKKRLPIYSIVAALGYFIGIALDIDTSIGLAFLVLGAISLGFVVYGCIIHGIILLTNK